MNIRFHCPSCHSSADIEEVMGGVIQFSTIDSIQKAETLGAIIMDYDGVRTEGGEVTHYQCEHCGWNLPCGNPEELSDWLQQNGMLEEGHSF